MTPSMASVGLPTRKFNVELVKKGRGHWYDVTSLSGEKLAFLPGVTGVLGVINKPLLIPWATNQGIARAVSSILALMGGFKDEEIESNATLISAGIKVAKKKDEFVPALAAFLADKFGISHRSIELTHESIASIVESSIMAPEKIKKEAADLGTMAHQVFDRVVKGETVKIEDVPEAVRVPVKSFLDWLDGSGIQLIMGDTRVASIMEGFGGSLDALGWKDGQYGILDWKTSSGIWPEYALQVAAYAQGFEETFGVPIGWAEIIRFDKTRPVFEHKRVANLTMSYGAFAAARELKNLLNEPQYDD